MKSIFYILICSLICSYCLCEEQVHFENYAFQFKKLSGFTEIEYKDNTSNQVLLYLKKKTVDSYDNFPTINIIKIPGSSPIHREQKYINTKKSLDMIRLSYQLSGLNVKDVEIFNSELWPNDKVLGALVTYENKDNEFKALSITIDGIEEHYIFTMIAVANDPELSKYLEDVKNSLIVKYKNKENSIILANNVAIYICYILLIFLALFLLVKRIKRKRLA